MQEWYRRVREEEGVKRDGDGGDEKRKGREG